MDKIRLEIWALRKSKKIATFNNFKSEMNF